MIRWPPGCRKANSLMLYTVSSITSHWSFFCVWCFTSSHVNSLETPLGTGFPPLPIFFTVQPAHNKWMYIYLLASLKHRKFYMKQQPIKCNVGSWFINITWHFQHVQRIPTHYVRINCHNTATITSIRKEINSVEYFWTFCTIWHTYVLSAHLPKQSYHLVHDDTAETLIWRNRCTGTERCSLPADLSLAFTHSITVHM